MFKSIKEFFVGKPKVEEPVVQAPEAVPAPEPTPVVEPVPAPVTETVTVVEPAPVVEEIKPETVVISISDNMNVSVNTQSDTITLTPPADPKQWPFPNTQPAEAEVKKKRTFVKRQEPATDKKPTPAITANKTKPRKKK
jgi:fused signal recognition particle receptor